MFIKEDMRFQHPGVTLYATPKTGDHLQQISELELIPQENRAFYYVKYTLDWLTVYSDAFNNVLLSAIGFTLPETPPFYQCRPKWISLSL